MENRKSMKADTQIVPWKAEKTTKQKKEEQAANEEPDVEVTAAKKKKKKANEVDRREDEPAEPDAGKKKKKVRPEKEIEGDSESKQTIPAKPLKRPIVWTDPDPEKEEEEQDEENGEEEEPPTPAPTERPRKAQWVSDGPQKKTKRLVGMVSVPFVRLRTKTSTDSLLEGVADSMKGHYVKKTHTRG